MLAGAAIGLASPAAAEPLSGPYSATAVEGFGMQTGTVSHWTLSPCGADCTHLHTGAGKGLDLWLQGNVWTGVDEDCAVTLDNSSRLVLNALSRRAATPTDISEERIDDGVDIRPQGSARCVIDAVGTHESCCRAVARQPLRPLARAV